LRGEGGEKPRKSKNGKGANGTRLNGGQREGLKKFGKQFCRGAKMMKPV
jgi:hypothetical protein